VIPRSRRVAFVRFVLGVTWLALASSCSAGSSPTAGRTPDPVASGTLGRARTALYMVWPESYRREAFPDVSASYRLAAQDVGGILLPAGDAWNAAWRRRPSLSLYGGDGFHPSMAGSYLAALTIYAGLTGASPMGLPVRLSLRDGANVEIGASDGPVLQAAAEEAVARQ
jgi:hypothetical protein